MPGSVHVTKAADIKTSDGQTEGMIRQGAIIDKCDKVCASVMIAKPHSSSAVHHHGEQDTIVYAVRGHGTVVSEGGKKRQDLSPGDFALIPAYAEHQEANDGDEEVTWIITRSGRTPIVENLEGWGES
ncbi:hypothetical protein MMC08_007106 [Hypocenomyce scalaris]|nr:hypothetical protein [Hypocenomyce scalaris]